MDLGLTKGTRTGRDKDGEDSDKKTQKLTRKLRHPEEKVI